MYYDRAEAGEQLVRQLNNYQSKPDTIILAIAGGGVVVADEIAKRLKLPLEVIVTENIFAKSNKQLLIGAICESGQPVIDESLIGTEGISPEYLDSEISQAKLNIKQRTNLYRANRKFNLTNKTVLLVSDGIVSDSIIKSILVYLQQYSQIKIIIVTPVIAKQVNNELKKQVSQLVYEYELTDSFTIGQIYEEYSTLTDQQICSILGKFH